jgi:hypothetical protein
LSNSSFISPRSKARELVLRFGWNATAYQILNPGIELWFSAAGDAVVGFVRSGGMVVVGGAPVCAPSRLSAVTAEFLAGSTTDTRLTQSGPECSWAPSQFGIRTTGPRRLQSAAHSVRS